MNLKTASFYLLAPIMVGIVLIFLYIFILVISVFSNQMLGFSFHLTLFIISFIFLFLQSRYLLHRFVTKFLPTTLKLIPFLIVVYFTNMLGVAWGFVVSSIPIKSEYSDTHWYFFNKATPYFPFTYNGLAYVTDTLRVPDSYYTFPNILTPDKNEYNLIIETKTFLYYLFNSAVISLALFIFVSKVIEEDRKLRR